MTFAERPIQERLPEQRDKYGLTPWIYTVEAYSIQAFRHPGTVLTLSEEVVGRVLLGWMAENHVDRCVAVQKAGFLQWEIVVPTDSEGLIKRLVVSTFAIKPQYATYRAADAVARRIWGAVLAVRFMQLVEERLAEFPLEELDVDPDC